MFRGRRVTPRLSPVAGLRVPARLLVSFSSRGARRWGISLTLRFTVGDNPHVWLTTRYDRPVDCSARHHAACTCRHRFQRRHDMSSDGYRPARRSQRATAVSVLGLPVHKNGLRESASRRMNHHGRPDYRVVTAGRYADIWPRVAAIAAAPPRITAAHSRRPAPAERVIKVPRAAGIGHKAPCVARNPRVTELWRPHPLPAPIWIPARIGRHIGRPHIPRARNVVPVAVCVQVIPGWVVAVYKTVRGLVLGSGFGLQRLVAIGIPLVPGIRFDRLGQVAGPLPP